MAIKRWLYPVSEKEVLILVRYLPKREGEGRSSKKKLYSMYVAAR
jgi:hypothetical protein